MQGKARPFATHKTGRDGKVLRLVPSPSTGVHHLAIQVSDLARVEAFYSDVLGLSILKRWDDDQGAPRSVWLSLGGEPTMFLALERCDGTAPSPPFRSPAPGLHLLALRITPDDRARWETHLVAHGVLVVHRSAFTLYVQDPEGNRIGLSHHPEAF